MIRNRQRLIYRVASLILAFQIVRILPCGAKRIRGLGNSCHDDNIVDVDVLIVGAGMAGVAAAKEIKSAGYTLAWIDADRESGGRMHKEDFGGYLVEAGAQWIAGTVGNPIYALAQEYNLLNTQQHWDKSKTYDVGGWMNGNGEQIPSQAIPWGDFDAAYHTLGQYAIDHLDDDEPPADRSVRDFFENMTSWTPRDGLDYAVEYFTLDYEHAWQPSNISVMHAFPEYTYLGNFVRREMVVHDPDGFRKIAVMYTDKEVGQQPKMTTKVVEFDLEDKKCSDRGKVIIKAVTTDYDTGADLYATKYRAKKVILTVSIGVLERMGADTNPPSNVIDIVIDSPQWEEQKEDMMDVYSMNGYHVLYFQFKQTWWGADEIIILAQAPEDRGKCTIWENLDAGTGQGFLPGSHIIRCAILTEVIKEFEDKSMDDDAIKKEILKPLHKIHKKKFNEDFDNDDVKFDYHNWNNDPYYHGSYEARKIDGTDEQFYNFITPLKNSYNDSVIYFAGSATCRSYYGFTHGAFWSGQRTANILLHDMDAVTFPLQESYCDQKLLVGHGNLHVHARGTPG